MVNYQFKNKVVLITGAASGIGESLCDEFLADGAIVVGWDLTPITKPGVFSVIVDVTDRETVTLALDKTLTHVGEIDYLLNSAGYAGITAPVQDYPDGEWDKIINVNLTGIFNICKTVLPHIKPQLGKIVNISSLAGKEGTPNAAAYSAAKAGVIAFTKSLGKELCEQGILVNSIAPAAVKTQLLEQMEPSHVQAMIDKSPMKRLGEVDEVTALVKWLCSTDCTFSTGAVFDLSGGRATY